MRTLMTSVLLLTSVVLCLPETELEAQGLRYDREYPVMRYSTRNPTDRVTELQRMIATRSLSNRYRNHKRRLVIRIAPASSIWICTRSPKT